MGVFISCLPRFLTRIFHKEGMGSREKGDFYLDMILVWKDISRWLPMENHEKMIRDQALNGVW